MISGIIRFVLFRVFGARVLLVLAVIGWVRRRLWRPSAKQRGGTATQRGGTSN